MAGRRAAVENDPWDISVKAMVAFPEILARMDEDIERTRPKHVLFDNMTIVVVERDAHAPESVGNFVFEGRASRPGCYQIPMGTFASADWRVNIAARAGRLWTSFCEALGLEPLLTDPLFCSPRERTADEAQLRQEVTLEPGAIRQMTS